MTSRLYNGVVMPDRPSMPNIRRLDMAALPMIDAMHEHGCLIDVEHFRKLGLKLDRLMEERLDRLRDLVGAGNMVNPNSPPEVANLLFHRLHVQGHAPLKMNDSLKWESTDADQLQRFRGDHPAVDAVLDYRHFYKLKSTYVGKLPRMLDDTGRLHTTFMPDRTATGRLASKNPNCFDGSTELLTDAGWMRFDNPDCKNHRAAQWDDGVISFVEPTAWIQSESREWVSIKSGHINLRVTPDHRCLVLNGKTGKKKVVPASKYPRHCKQVNAGLWEGGEGLPLSDAQLKFCIAAQADSHITKYAFDFGFRKKRKYERLLSILGEIGEDFKNYTNDKRYRLAVPFTAWSSRWAKPRKFGPWLLGMSRSQADVFCSEIFHWDGCITRMNHYASACKGNADWVQIILSLSGVRSRLRRYVSQGGSVSWQVDVSRNNYSLTTNSVKTQDTLLEEEDAYCCSVPSGFIVVRRDQDVMVTGQCQNIPKRQKVEGQGDLGKEIRSGFVASPGYVLLARDLSQIEMRWGAHYSQEPVMVQGYKDPNFDMHTQNAMDVFGLPREQIDVNKHRLPSKTIGFGVLYMIGAAGLRSAIINAGAPPADWPEEKCQQLIDRFYEARPCIRDWQALQFWRARRHGMVWDAFGRVRLIPQVRSSLEWVRSEGLRQAANMPIQASAQGTLKLAMAELYDMEKALNDRYPGNDMVRVLLQLHDELLWEVREDYFIEWFESTRDVMENGCPLSVPILSSGDYGERWGQMETIQ